MEVKTSVLRSRRADWRRDRHRGSGYPLTPATPPYVRSCIRRFGGEQSHGNTCDQNYHFAGMYRDGETGNDYTQFRMYESNLGRWMTPDPLGGDISNPQSLNRYAYVLNNPVNFIDPLGLQCSNVFNGSWEGSGYPPCGDASTHTSQPAESPTSIAGPVGVAVGSMIGYVSPEMAWGEKRYADNFGWLVQGSLYGKYYEPTFFSSLDAYFNWRTDIAALPASQEYAAWQLACEHSTVACTNGMTVWVQRTGATYSVTVPGSVADVGFPGTLPDPLTIEHPSWSYYTWSPIDPGHVVPLPGGYVQAHHDAFNPWFLTPLHMVEWVVGHLTGGQSSTATCSVIGGCQ